VLLYAGFCYACACRCHANERGSRGGRVSSVVCARESDGEGGRDKKSLVGGPTLLASLLPLLLRLTAPPAPRSLSPPLSTTTPLFPRDRTHERDSTAEEEEERERRARARERHTTVLERTSSPATPPSRNEATMSTPAKTKQEAIDNATMAIKVSGAARRRAAALGGALTASGAAAAAHALGGGNSGGIDDGDEAARMETHDTRCLPAREHTHDITNNPSTDRSRRSAAATSSSRRRSALRSRSSCSRRRWRCVFLPVVGLISLALVCSSSPPPVP
jgi:hypothetical protein